MSNTNPCGGQGLFEVNDPCALLPQLRAAYYTLLAGEGTATISMHGRLQTFHKPDSAALRAEIERLEQVCPQSAANPRPMGGHSTSVVASVNRWR